jgi:hypothetical protein
MKWTEFEAKQWIVKVNSGKEKYGLKYCSACDFLKITISSAKLMKRV